jgi:hypothetical protein
MFTIKQLSLYALLASAITFATLGTVVAQPVVNENKNFPFVHGVFADGSSWLLLCKIHSRHSVMMLMRPNGLLRKWKGLWKQEGTQRWPGLIYVAASIPEGWTKRQ